MLTELRVCLKMAYIMNRDERSKIINLQELKVSCSDCSLHQLCLPKMISKEDMHTLNNIIVRGKSLKRGELLFNFNDTFRSIYVVRSGSLKTVYAKEDGIEQVIGFYLAGELLGFDAINGYHPCSAKALETSNVCEVPFEHLEALSARMPSLQHQLLRLMSKEINTDQNVMVLLGKKNAEVRLASYLLSISSRYQQRGFFSQDFYLSMSRSDIGSYLGLAVETVSRTFSLFQEQDVLMVERRHIIIKDRDYLQRLANGSDECGADVNKNVREY